MTYRHEVDGLRAVAVLAVLLCHVGAAALPGGFVGVDVFFVISGYVITGVLARDLEAGTFSLAGFYERRIRRIAPALLVVIPLTAIASAFILLPPDLDSFGKSAVSAALMVSNVHFWREAGYFDAAAHTKPLLHTWSLGIEEQFYLVYPLFLAWLWRSSRLRTTRALAAVAAVSFGLSVWAVGAHPTAAFYLAPFRFWELLLGALVALAPVRRLQGTPAAALGLAMIVAACLIYQDGTPFPGTAALLPAVGAALVINGAQGGTIAARWLGARPLSFVGKISYSLYLVHWPLIVLLEYRQGAALGPWQAAAVILASIGLAALSWRFVEQPFRHPARSGLFWRVLGTAAAATGVSCMIGMSFDVTDGFAGHLPENVRAAFAARNDIWRDSDWCLLDTKGRAGPQPKDIRAGRICAFGGAAKTANEAGRPNYLIWGDSHASSMAPAILDAAARHGAKGEFVGAASCPPLIDYRLTQVRDVVETRCREVNEAVLQHMAKDPPAYVFLIARWPKYALGSEFGDEGQFFDPAKIYPPAPGEDLKVEKALDQTLDRIGRLGVTPVLVMDVPEPGYDVPYAYAKDLLEGQKPDLAPSRAEVEARQARPRQILAEAARKHGGVFIDPATALCDDKSCRIEKDGTLLYRDEDHLSQTGAKSLSPLYDDVFATMMRSALLAKPAPSMASK